MGPGRWRGRATVPLAVVFFAGACGADRRSRSTNLDEGYVAQRVVSLLPSVTEMVSALGASDRLVARTDDERDPALAHLPSVGHVLTPSLEALTAVEPDLVIAWTGADLAAITRAVELGGGRVRTIKVDRLGDLAPGITQVGTWIGRTAAADSVKAEVARTLQRARRVGSSGKKLRAMWVVWSDPIIVAGPGNFLHDIVEIVGGHNVVEERDVPWPRVGIESLVWLDPEVLIWPEGPGMFPASDLNDRRGWKMLRAVREGRVLVVDPERFHDPGPDIAQAVLELAERLKEMRER